MARSLNTRPSTVPKSGLEELVGCEAMIGENSVLDIAATKIIGGCDNDYRCEIRSVAAMIYDQVEMSDRILVVQGRSVPLPLDRRGRLGPYNGFTGLERARGAQIIRWAKSVGLVSAPSSCSVCGVRAARMHLHCENYYEPLDVHPICVSCHVKLHQRFRSPKPWRALVALHGDESAWFSVLSLTPIDMAAELRAEFGSPATDIVATLTRSSPASRIRVGLSQEI